MNLKTNKCENYPDKCVKEICSYEAHYVYLRKVRIGFCTFKNCEYIPLSYVCNENKS